MISHKNITVHGFTSTIFFVHCHFCFAEVIVLCQFYAKPYLSFLIGWFFPEGRIRARNVGSKDRRTSEAVTIFVLRNSHCILSTSWIENTLFWLECRISFTYPTSRLISRFALNSAGFFFYSISRPLVLIGWKVSEPMLLSVVCPYHQTGLVFLPVYERNRRRNQQSTKQNPWKTEIHR